MPRLRRTLNTNTHTHTLVVAAITTEGHKVPRSPVMQPRLLTGTNWGFRFNASQHLAVCSHPTPPPVTVPDS